MRSLSVVIPALNELHNIEHVVRSVPVQELSARGWSTEILVVDNASTDGTGAEAARVGARVVHQPHRGYGNAYKAGFTHATGDVIVTGDADRTYPLDHIPALLDLLEHHDAEFLTTDRLRRENANAMKRSHVVGNRVLSAVSRLLFRNGVRDSQSGMWVFRRAAWDRLDVRSPGMQFSQELKNEAYRRGLRCAEVPIEYRPRGGDVKLNALRDGLSNLGQLFHHRFRKDALATSYDEHADEVLPDELATTPVGGMRLGHVVNAVLATVVVAGALVLIFPALRHQLAISATREPDQYVELSFADVNTTRSCPSQGNRLQVPIELTGHFADASVVGYDVAVTSAREPGLPGTHDSVLLQPGEHRTVTADVRVPRRGAYTVEVTLPGRTQHLLLHCGGGAS